MTATSKRSKRTTAADVAAAVALGALDPSTVLNAPDDSPEPESQQVAATVTAALSATAHECGIPGCRHGAAHGKPQPDRQLKLAAECGAVVRCTARALATAGGSLTDAHGHPFAVAARRTYVRKSA